MQQKLIAMLEYHLKSASCGTTYILMAETIVS